MDIQLQYDSKHWLMWIEVYRGQGLLLLIQYDGIKNFNFMEIMT